MNRKLVFLYHFLWTLFIVILLPLVPFSRSRRLRERLGLFIPSRSPEQSGIWIHALSVGEIISAIPLLKSLKQAYPSKHLVFTVATSQGLEVAREELEKEVRDLFTMPIDFWWSIRRAVRFVNPSIFILVETDIWPGLIFYLKDKGVKTVLVNGRVSRRTARSYGRFRCVSRPILDSLELCLMQTELDRSRLLRIGVNPEKVKTVGNIKFDREWIPMSKEEQTEWMERLKLDSGNPLWVAGSTHDGEEQILMDVFEGLRRLFPTLQLIIAPRRIERSGDILKLFQSKGFRASLRTELEAEGRPFDVLILNTIGELSRVYGIGQISFVGGTLVSEGGHNLLEPASFGLPVLFGPHTHNFAFMSQLLIEAGGGKRVMDGETLFQVMRELLSEPEKSEAMGRRAKAFVQMNKGALKRVLEYLEACR